jgi:hypothetical protein
LFLGVTTQPKSNWEQYLAPPVATRSKKAESQAAEVAEKQAERVATLATTPFAATATHIKLVDRNNSVIYEGNSSRNLLAALSPHVASMNHRGCLDSGRPWLFAIEARNTMRLVAIDAMQQPTPEGGEQVYYSYWLRRALDPVPWADPRDLLMSTEQRHEIGPHQLRAYFGLKAAPATLATNPTDQIAWLIELANAARLVGRGF